MGSGWSVFVQQLSWIVGRMAEVEQEEMEMRQAMLDEEEEGRSADGWLWVWCVCVCVCVRVRVWSEWELRVCWCCVERELVL